jgi:hypothetical protein
MRRFYLISVWVSLLGLIACLSRIGAAAEAEPIEKSLPASTYAFIKINNYSELKASFGGTSLAELCSDAAMKPLLDELSRRFQRVLVDEQGFEGVSIRELSDLPRGEVTLAVVGIKDPKIPAAILLSVDAGTNSTAVEKFCRSYAERLKKKGGTVRTETFQAFVLTIIEPAKQPEAASVNPPVYGVAAAPSQDLRTVPPGVAPNPPPGVVVAPGQDLNAVPPGVAPNPPPGVVAAPGQDLRTVPPGVAPNPPPGVVAAPGQDLRTVPPGVAPNLPPGFVADAPVQGAGEHSDVQTPIVWTRKGDVFYFATDSRAIKDLLSAGTDRGPSLFSTLSYSKMLGKVDPDARLIWYVNVAAATKKIAKATAGFIGSLEFGLISDLLGLNSFRGVGGALAFSTNKYDYINQTFVITNGEPRGAFKLVRAPSVDLSPEAWVPESIGFYQSWSWDARATYAAFKDLSSLLDEKSAEQFRQSVALVFGSEINEDVLKSFQNRITLIGDFADAESIESMELVLSIANKEGGSFGLLTKLLGDRLDVVPRRREFQGTTIYEFDWKDDQIEADPKFQSRRASGVLSVAEAKGSIFIATGKRLLERVLDVNVARSRDSIVDQFVRAAPDKLGSVTMINPNKIFPPIYRFLKSDAFVKLTESDFAIAEALGVGPVKPLPRFQPVQVPAPGEPAVVDPSIRQAEGDAPKDEDSLQSLIGKLPEASVIARRLVPFGGYMIQDKDGLTYTSYALKRSKR